MFCSLSFLFLCVWSCVPGFSLLREVPGMQVNSLWTGTSKGGWCEYKLCLFPVVPGLLQGWALWGRGVYCISVLSACFSPSTTARDSQTQGLNQIKTPGEKTQHTHWGEKGTWWSFFHALYFPYLNFCQIETFHLTPCLSDLYLMIHSDDIAKLIFIESRFNHLQSPL